MSSHDPGDLYDPPPRRKRREDESDDVWAAADEDDLGDPSADIEDLAAGYHWQDRDRYGIEPPADPTLPDLASLPPGRRTRPRRGDTPGGRLPRQYDRDELYANSPTYQRDQNQRRRADPRFEGGEESPPAPARRGKPRGLPFWQILILVILGLTALLAVCLALASLMTL